MNAERRAWNRAVSIAAIVVMVGVGFCLLHTDGDHHGATAGLDLCVSMIVTAFAPALLVELHDAGRAAAVRRWTAAPVTVAVLDPPPWP